MTQLLLVTVAFEDRVAMRAPLFLIKFPGYSLFTQLPRNSRFCDGWLTRLDAPAQNLQLRHHAEAIPLVHLARLDMFVAFLQSHFVPNIITR